MVYLNDPELKDLNWQKKCLLLKENKKEITEEELKKQLEELQPKIDVKIREHLDRLEYKSTINNSTETEELNKMAEEKKEKPLAEMSNAKLILKALQLKTVKNYDDVGAKVKEWKPTVEDKKIKAMAKVMVREIKAGKGGKAKKYTWKDEGFILEPVTE